MKTKQATAQTAKEAEAERKASLRERLTQEANAASERIRKRFDEDRAALARRYGGATTFAGDHEKN